MMKQVHHDRHNMRNHRYKKIAYLGIPGSYTFTAAQKYFATTENMLGVKTLSEIFKKVTTGVCEFGVIPLENTTTGNITDTFDHLMENKLSIIGEIILKIRHQFLVNKKQKSIKEVKYCYSHPQAISQCEAFFTCHPWIKLKYTRDTASAAKIVSQRKKMNEAVIAGKVTAKIYDMKILAKNIEDNPNNYTRFSVISKKESFVGNKISLLFSVEHKPGSLFRCLAPYARLGLNLTKIESRPVFGKPWEYIFFIDFEIGKKEKELKQVLEEMKEHVNFFKILGRYKKG